MAAALVLVLAGTGAALAQGGEAASDAAESGGRVFVDTTVADVIVDDRQTVAIMAQSPQSPCPSDRYVFDRARPKWLNTTGRILEAMREGATLRISFSCVRGLQSINAIQFLSPPVALPTGTPRRRQAVREAPAGIAGSSPPGESGLPEALRAGSRRAAPPPGDAAPVRPTPIAPSPPPRPETMPSAVQPTSAADDSPRPIPRP